MTEKTLDRQRQEGEHQARLILSVVATALTGYATYLIQSYAPWEQWTYLLHTGLGIYLTAAFLAYIPRHYQRTQSVRRPALSLLGILSVVAVLVFVATGLHIAIAGQKESLRYVYTLHVAAATAALGLILIHVLGFLLFTPTERRDKLPTWTIFRTRLRRLPLNLCGWTVLIGAASVVSTFLPSPFRDEPVVTPYEYSYGPHPFRPSQTETSLGGFMDVKRIGNSDDCAACHARIAEEWRASIHSQAASDQAYQTNVNLLAEKKSMAATRYCEGCHAPVPLLSGQLTRGGHLDTPGHLREGVSCMACHGIDKVIHTKGVASFRLAVSTAYLFEGSKNPLANKLHNYLIRIQPRQHRRDMAREVLAEPELCATCHAQFMDKDINEWGWVKMQDDYTAWLNSPYSGQTQHTFADSRLRRCQDCHFPLVKGQDPSANEQGEIKSHRALAANTAIPWVTGDDEQLRRTQEFLESNKLRVSIDKPTRNQATRSRKYMRPDLTENVTEKPGYFYLGEEINVDVVVANVGVGHDFPGGTIDINEAWVHFRAVDAQNSLIFESGAIDPAGDVDRKAYFYRSIPIDRYGNPVWRHDLFKMVGDSFRKVIPSGQSDKVSYAFIIPSWTKSPLTLSAVVKYQKLNTAYARWALKDQTLNLPVTDLAQNSLSVPIRIRPEVVTGGWEPSMKAQ